MRGIYSYMRILLSLIQGPFSFWISMEFVG